MTTFYHKQTISYPYHIPCEEANAMALSDMPGIPALGMLGQKGWEFEASLGYMVMQSNNQVRGCLCSSLEALALLSPARAGRNTGNCLNFRIGLAKVKTR